MNEAISNEKHTSGYTKPRAFLCYFVLLFLLLTPSLGLAQTSITGALAGTVTDSQGLAIPNAQAKLSNLATGETRSVISDGKGRYRFPLLAPGTYRIDSSASGFKTGDQSGIQIAVT